MRRPDATPRTGGVPGGMRGASDRPGTIVGDRRGVPRQRRHRQYGRDGPVTQAGRARGRRGRPRRTSNASEELPVEPPLWAWIALILGVPVLAAVDLLLFGRGEERVSVKKAAVW